MMPPLLIAAAQDVAGGNTLQWLLDSEGWFFWIQAPLAVLMLTLILSAFDMTRRGLLMPKELLRHLGAGGGPPKPLPSVPNDDEVALARAVRAGLAAGSDEEAAARVEEACEEVALAMDRRLSWIGTCSNAAMSIGLLGTVWGLVLSFTTIARSGQAPPPNELAEGVSMALVTTIFGLLTAIPGIFACGVLRPRGNRLLYDLERTSLALVAKLRAAPPPVPPPAPSPVPAAGALTPGG